MGLLLDYVIKKSGNWLRVVEGIICIGKPARLMLGGT